MLRRTARVIDDGRGPFLTKHVQSDDNIIIVIITTVFFFFFFLSDGDFTILAGPCPRIVHRPLKSVEYKPPRAFVSVAFLSVCSQTIPKLFAIYLGRRPEDTGYQGWPPDTEILYYIIARFVYWKKKKIDYYTDGNVNSFFFFFTVLKSNNLLILLYSRRNTVDGSDWIVSYYRCILNNSGIRSEPKQYSYAIYDNSRLVRDDRTNKSISGLISNRPESIS